MKPCCMFWFWFFFLEKKIPKAFLEKNTPRPTNFFKNTSPQHIGTSRTKAERRSCTCDRSLVFVGHRFFWMWLGVKRKSHGSIVSSDPLARWAWKKRIFCIRKVIGSRAAFMWRWRCENYHPKDWNETWHQDPCGYLISNLIQILQNEGCWRDIEVIGDHLKQPSSVEHVGKICLKESFWSFVVLQAFNGTLCCIKLA